MRVFAACVAIAALSILPTRAAFASPGITGYSGKTYNGANETCKTRCHTGGGAAPTLTVDVPDALKAGDTGQVTVTVDGTRQRTSMNAAFSVAVKATGGQNTTVPFPVETPDEVAAVVPPPDGADATYKFSFVAPQRNGPLTLYVAAISANGGGQEGDGVAVTTKTITISGATDTPPSSPADAGTSSKDGGKGGTGTSDDEDDEKTSSGSGKRLPRTSTESSGCQSSPTTPSNLALLAITATLLLTRRRHRRR